MDRSLLEEAAKRFGGRAEQRTKNESAVNRYLGTVFDKQKAFILDPSREKAALCTRRAGKTSAVARYLYKEVLQDSDAWSLYFGLTREKAKDLMWPELERANDVFRLGMKLNVTELTAKLRGGGIIKLTGADKAKEIEKWRGYKVRVAIVDECQSFGPHLNPLVNDVLSPALMDCRGTVAMIGTPGVRCAGYWYDVTGPKGKEREGWSTHRWSVLDNPFVPHAAEELARLKQKRGWTDETPVFRREYLGEWVEDDSDLFYKLNDERNTFTELPPANDWQCVLGWDLGFNDAMALVVWGYSRHHPHLYEMYSWKKSGITTSVIVEEVNRLRSRFNITAMVADTGGLGKLIVEELKQREGLHFEAAKKTEKFAHVELLNDQLLAGRIKVRHGSPLHSEMALLPKDPDSPPHLPPREDPRFENHCADAALYGWRRAFHWLHEPEEKKPARGSEEAIRADEQAMEAALARELEESREREWWE